MGTLGISAAAFRDCDELTAITIPESVTVIGGNPFTSCKQLTSIAVSSANPCFITKKRTFYSHLFMKRATIYNYQQQIIAAGRSTHSTMVFQQGFWIGAEIR